ncbi:pyridoxal phosphate-dependent transferase [Suillus occidentalis]|nr:pyridoxal phosphate-dependent transferase [Suillus occidentalis]
MAHSWHVAIYTLVGVLVCLAGGSYGSSPIPVRVACDKLSTHIKTNPYKFLCVEYIQHWIKACTRVAKLIGADTDECVLVNNTLYGISTILCNFEWHKGDIIIGKQSDFQQTHKIVAIVDAIAANPEMVAICRDAGVWSVVDATHSIGQKLDINLLKVKPDFLGIGYWAGQTCHKWLFAKRSCAVLYVPKQNQHVIKSCIPTPCNYYSPLDEDYNGPQNFVNLFEWTGTINYVPFLSYKINEYTHNPAIAGGKHLASLLGNNIMNPDSNLTLNMVNLELPIPGDIKYLNEINDLLKNTLLFEWNVYTVHYYHNRKWWTRCSMQIWNEVRKICSSGDLYDSQQ